MCLWNMRVFASSSPRVYLALPVWGHALGIAILSNEFQQYGSKSQHPGFLPLPTGTHHTHSQTKWSADEARSHMSLQEPLDLEVCTGYPNIYLVK